MKTTFIIIIILSFFCSCKQRNFNNDNSETQPTLIQQQFQKDIYINREFYAGDELNEVTVVKSQKTSIDSISYSIYKIRANGKFIFSIEKLLRNDDVALLKIIDTINLSTNNDIQVDISKDQNNYILNLKQNNKVLKKWTFNLNTRLPSDNSLKNKLLTSFDYDLNKDGTDDKIEIFENKNGNDDFEKKHFNLNIKIYKGTNDGLMEWTSNNNLIFSPSSNCIAEGFNTIITKNNFFTIEQNMCSNYISISSYITFKVIDDAIYLHKYGEEYFDKADHDRKIPTKTWTTKDFGKIKFEDVTEEILFNLRN